MLEIIKKCIALDKKDKEPKNMALRILKLGEEFGELAESYLVLNGYKKSKQPKAATMKNFKGEIGDILIMTLVIAARSGMTPEEIDEVLTEKLKKWERKHLRKKKPSMKHKKRK